MSPDTPLLGGLVTYADSSVRTVMPRLLAVGLPVVVDSGAWSVFTGQATIPLAEHTDWVISQQVDAIAGAARYVGLDVIGNPVRTHANWVTQRAAGAHVEPTLHFGEAPSEVLRYLDPDGPGLASPWINLGGMVPYLKHKKNHPMLAAWAAAVRRELRDAGHHEVLLHGLGQTSAISNRLFPYDGIDSIYWLSPTRLHRSLPLFDSRSGRFRVFRVAQRSVKWRTQSWKELHAHAAWLRAEYGLSAAQVADSTNEALLTLTIRSYAHFVTYMRARHGHDLIGYLAGASGLTEELLAVTRRASVSPDDAGLLAEPTSSEQEHTAS